VISWSLNPPEIITQEEKGAPNLESRLQAAKSCERAGYKIGFHFDPVIHYPDWESGYRFVVQEIPKFVAPESIAWISLGALRYPPQLNKLIKQRHRKSRAPFGELFQGKDGKLRYLKVIRQEMFRKIVQWIREVDPGIFVYLCMESPEIWDYVFGEVPGGKYSVSNCLDRRCGVCIV
jgi:spore photoproduct lyase